MSSKGRKPEVAIIADHKKAFITLNAIFFGCFMTTMGLTILYPSVQLPVTKIVSAAVRADIGAAIYATGNIVYAARATLAVNLVMTMVIAVPSLVIPYFGVAFALTLALAYGITLAPIGPHPATMIPHYLAVFIEFEAYVIAAFGAYAFGRSVYGHPAPESGKFVQKWLQGVKAIMPLYYLVTPLLVAGSLFEAFEIIYLWEYFM